MVPLTSYPLYKRLRADMKNSSLLLVSETSNHFLPLTMGKCLKRHNFLQEEAANGNRREMPRPAFQDDHSEFSSILNVSGGVEGVYGGMIVRSKLFISVKLYKRFLWSPFL